MGLIEFVLLIAVIGFIIYLITAFIPMPKIFAAGMIEKMPTNDITKGFTVYLEGHEGHQGNVLLHSFLLKVQRLTIVLNKLERAYIEKDNRQTDFEIIDADKVNPTSLTLKPVPKVKSYDPTPAFQWSIKQIDLVSKGQEPDDRVNRDIADELVKLATKDSEYGYKKFWVNGYAEAVEFDKDFLIHALKLSQNRAKQETPLKWHTGVSHGSVVGELKAIDDIEGGREFVIIPPSGADAIKCIFPDNMRDEMRKFLFKIVTVKGNLHYTEKSAFPAWVDADLNGIEIYPQRPPRKKLSDMRGIFKDRERRNIDWDDILSV